MGSGVPPSYQDELNRLLVQYREAMEADPQDAQTLVDMATVLLKLERTDEAMRSLRRAAWVCFNRANYEEAVAICGRVFRLRPVDSESQQLVEEIRRAELLDPTALEEAMSRGRARRVSDGQPVVVLSREVDATTPAWDETLERALPPDEVAPTDNSPHLRQLRQQLLGGKPPWELDTLPLSSAQHQVAEDLEPQDPHDPDADGPTLPQSDPGLDLPIPDEIVNQVPRRWYPAGSMILEERTRCRALMLLEQGRVTVTKADIELMVLSPGDFIGELAVLGDGRAHAGYRAVDDCTLLMFEDESLRQVLQLPRSSTAIRKSYRDRLQQMLVAVSPLLSALPATDARQLLRRCRPMRLEDGQVLVREGDAPVGVFFVMLGRLVVTEGARVLEQLGDGDHVGELAVLRDTPSQQTVTAHGFCQLVQLQPSDLIQFAAQNAKLGALLQQHAARRERRYQAMRES